MTAKEFAPFYKLWEQKDIITANLCINELYRFFDDPAQPRKKALVIFNKPHSCRYYKNADYGKFFAYQIIADRFPSRTANVVVNWAVCSNDEGYTSLSNGGKIDAAFAACGNKSVGFDLAGTPFADYLFDYGDPQPTDPTTFSKVYHGFIFYKPVTQWVDAVGVPYIEKIDCRDELARRSGVWDNEEAQSASEAYKDEKLEYYSRLRSFQPAALFPGFEELIEKQISQYYRPAPALAVKVKK